MARPTGTRAAARRRRLKHEQRITAQANPLDQLGQTYAWLRSEAARVPHLLHDTIDRLKTIAAELNEHAQEGDQR